MHGGLGPDGRVLAIEPSSMPPRPAAAISPPLAARSLDYPTSASMSELASPAGLHHLHYHHDASPHSSFPQVRLIG